MCRELSYVVHSHCGKQREKLLSGVSSHKGTNPTCGLYPHDLMPSKRPHLLTLSHWGSG